MLKMLFVLREYVTSNYVQLIISCENKLIAGNQMPLIILGTVFRVNQFTLTR